jgi:hypothetical protein
VTRHAVLLALLLCPLARAQGEGPKAAPFPLERLDPAVRKQVRAVRGDATVTARIPTQTVRAPASVYRALLARLPLASRWLKALDLGDYTIRDLPKGGFLVDDKLGARARCARALDEEGQLVVVAGGSLEVAVLPKIQGTGVILVRYAPPDPAAPAVLAATAEVDFRVASGLLHMLSRPFRKTLERVLADKMADLITSATALAEAIHRDPSGTLVELKAKGVAAEDLEAFRKLFLSL